MTQKKQIKKNLKVIKQQIIYLSKIVQKQSQKTMKLKRKVKNKLLLDTNHLQIQNTMTKDNGMILLKLKSQIQKKNKKKQSLN